MRSPWLNSAQTITNGSLLCHFTRALTEFIVGYVITILSTSTVSAYIKKLGHQFDVIIYVHVINRVTATIRFDKAVKVLLQGQ
jgi:hypothetical protein